MWKNNTIIFITGTLLLSALDAFPIYDSYSDMDIPFPVSKERSTRLRQKRSIVGIHNYAYEVISHIVNADGTPGPWWQRNCDAVYNCETISRHHCISHQYFFKSDNQAIKTCSIDFNMYVPSKTIIRGIDLAFYKASEAESNDFYLVYILAITQSHDVDLAAYRIIPAQCSGWQIFHLDNEVISRYTHEGDNDLTFEIVVSRNFSSILPCETVRSLFLLNATAYEAPENSTELREGSGEADLLENESTPPNNESIPILATTEAPSTETDAEKMIDPFSLTDNEKFDHVPVLNMFYSTMSGKRDVDGSGGEKKNWCLLAKKVIHIKSTVKINRETFTVIAPREYNIGECRTSTHRVKEECLPKRHRPLELMVSRWIEGKEFVSIYNSSEVMVIEECG